MHDDLNMKPFFYTLSFIMVIAWALCYFVYSFNEQVHLLLPLALLLAFVGEVKKH